MSGIYQSVKSCIFKTPSTEKTEVIRSPDDIKETDGNSSLMADKKTDEVNDPTTQPGILWRMSSGVYNTASGAVGMGVGGVKWVAGKTYDAGSAVYSKAPSNPLRKKKDKNE
ncbi:hypothetical protein LOTGIDRAFT_160606 [Lottia gigantea]|uniref:Uncharacterized protein n=1 Tax=Lottia gigantea TaxID=225164 RepID=V4APA3_LOTGI|nr:hypothetical protein LOTGIDRAFT_160606 [Lottia gigantea]ESO95456.1 hypothetical protein LOTGIDRAFT_160606 [Lottia gigantea]